MWAVEMGRHTPRPAVIQAKRRRTSEQGGERTRCQATSLECSCPPNKASAHATAAIGKGHEALRNGEVHLISLNPPVICGGSYNEQRGQNSWLSSPSTSLDLSTLLSSSPSLLDLPCISLVEIFIPSVILFLTLRCRSFHVFSSLGQH